MQCIRVNESHTTDQISVWKLSDSNIRGLFNEINYLIYLIIIIIETDLVFQEYKIIKMKKEKNKLSDFSLAVTVSGWEVDWSSHLKLLWM